MFELDEHLNSDRNIHKAKSSNSSIDYSKRIKYNFTDKQNYVDEFNSYSVVGKSNSSKWPDPKLFDDYERKVQIEK